MGKGELLELINGGRGELCSCYKLMGEGKLLEVIDGEEGELSSYYKSMGGRAQLLINIYVGGRRTQLLCYSCTVSMSTSATLAGGDTGEAEVVRSEFGWR
jgi:hypothetical protein